MAKHTLNIGYLQITDHLILGMAAEKKSHSYSLKPHLFESWEEIESALSHSNLDGAFMLAPLAMLHKLKGKNVKLVLLGHREGSVFVLRKGLKYSSIKDLKNKVIGIPHKLSKHTILLNKILSKENLSLGKDVHVKTIAPSKMVHSLSEGKIDGYIVAEPYGSQAEEENVGKIIILSREIEKHHPCCVLVLKDKLIKDRPKVVQELVDNLVHSGVSMNDNPEHAAEVGVSFLDQKKQVLQKVLTGKERRITSWDLVPVIEEFEKMQDYVVDTLHIAKKKIHVHDFVDDTFAKKAYKKISIHKERIHKTKTLIEKIALPFFVIFGLIAVWQIIANSGMFLPSLLPAPMKVLTGTVELYEKGVLFGHIGASLFRVLTGFFLAALFAIPLGLLLGSFRYLRIAFDPLLQILRPISPIAWIPLAILWFGIGDKPAIFIIFITSFFPILLAAASSVKNIDPILVKSAINFGASNLTLVKKVILPASIPYIIIGLRISLGIAWVIVVAAEMVGMRSGLGFMILDSRNYLRTDLIISGMVIVGIIGLTLDKIMSVIEKKIKRKWAFQEAIE